MPIAVGFGVLIVVISALGCGGASGHAAPASVTPATSAGADAGAATATAEATAARPAGPLVLRGTVKDAAGAPVVGAWVAANAPGALAPAATTRSDAGGAFALEVVAGDFAAGQGAYGNLDEAERRAVADGLGALERRFDADAKAWKQQTGAAAYATARHDLTVVRQAATMYEADARGVAASPSAFDIRDRSMAENVIWLLEQEPKGTRMVLWAHNGHIAYQLPALVNLGSHLARRFGRDYLPVGFVFGEGAFQAMDGTGVGTGLKEFTLGPPPEHDMSAPFLRAGCTTCVLDLRRLPAGVVRTWFQAARPMRSTGAVFTSEAAMSGPECLSKDYAAVFFVARTTRARPLPRP